MKVKVPSTSYDVSTPVNVVASAYGTSGNGGRKLVRLSNGWLVAVVFQSGTAHRFYVDKMDGNGWVPLCYRNTSMTSSSFAITSFGTVIYLLATSTSSTNVKPNLNKFDVTTVANSDISGATQEIDASQPSINSVSITAHTDGTLHAAWTSKNSTYPNSFNIRHSKSTNGGATWASPVNLGNFNTSGINAVNPCIVVLPSGLPYIVFEYTNTPSSIYQIRSYQYTGSTWTAAIDIYDGGSRVQGPPCATVAPDGTIHVVWQGKDATDSAKFNIRYSSSSDGGATWATAVKLTTGNTYDQTHPSIVSDLSGDLYVRFQGRSSGSYDQIRSIVYSGGSWGSVTDITTNTTASANYPQVCEINKFTEPLTIWQDNQGVAVKFTGVWFTGGWSIGTGSVKVSGAWKTVSSVFTKVSGVWKTA